MAHQQSVRYSKDQELKLTEVRHLLDKSQAELQEKARQLSNQEALVEAQQADLGDMLRSEEKLQAIISDVE